MPQDISSDHYTVERELGRGGMATVYVARDTKHGRRVALKVLRPELAASLGAERFRREVTLAASLQHPHIVPVHDSGETPSGVLWFTMPLIEGRSLRERLREEHQLPVDEAIGITREMALALDYAHRHGVIHRDVKPENILLVDGQAMLADFGIARPFAATTPGETLTATGMAVGTPTYMSPEQAAGERTVGSSTDIYSLGAVLYEMLAGEPPYTGPTAQAIAAKMLTGDVPSVRRARPSVPEAIDTVIRKALSPVPADRYASGAAFAAALQTAERTPSAPADLSSFRASASRRAGRRRVAGLAALSLGLIGLALAGLFFAWRPNGSRAAGAAGSDPIALAVLPFDTEGDTANAYFADGIADEIRGKLSALPGLQVMARTSSNAYRHSSKAPSEIARELGVRYLLTGTVRWERDPRGSQRVRVSPELIDAGGAQGAVTRWQQSYDTTLADVFDVQSAVATRVADRLGVVLTSPAETQLAARPTKNVAAYDAYLRSAALDGQDPATLRRALVGAEEAIALDSGFAQAWAQASLLHARIYFHSIPTPTDADAARRGADRAVALAPVASDGYYALGAYNLLVARNLAAAQSGYENAARLNPSSTLATGAAATVQAALGHWTTGLVRARQSAALDPRSAIAAARLSAMLLHLRRYAESRTAAERGLTIEPANIALITNRAVSFLGEGDLAGGRAALRDVPPALDRATLAVSMGRGDLSYWAGGYVAYWALDSADRALLLTLPTERFDNDRAEWGLVRAELYWLNADTVNARRSAGVAQATLQTQLLAAPDDDRRHLSRGLALAYLGQSRAAASEGERGLALALATGDGYRIPYARHTLAQIYLVTGDHPKAIEQLAVLLSEPYAVSAGWLRIDPTWTPLQVDPRFQRLLAQPPTAPTE